MKTYFQIISTILLIFVPQVVAESKSSTDTSSNHSFLISQSFEYEIKREKDGRYTAKSKVQIKKQFLDEKSLKEDYYNIHNPSYMEVKKPKVKINDKKMKHGNISKYNPLRYDTFFSDQELYQIRFPKDLEVNDIATIRYKEYYDDLAYFPINEIFNEGKVTEFTLSFKHPADITIEFDIYFPRDSLPYEITRESNQLTTISFLNIEQDDELDYNFFNDIHAEIITIIKKDSFYITPVTPESFTRWYNAQTDLSPSFTFQENDSLKQLIDGRETSDGKIEEIYDYIKENVRYISDLREGHTHIPFEPLQVYDNKYGDCKDKACLASAIAKEENINVKMALVPSLPFRTFKYLNTFLYNHVISSYQSGGVIRFFDPTYKFVPIDNLPERVIGKKLLILDSDNPRNVVATNQLSEPSLDVKLFLDLVNFGSIKSTKATITLKNNYYNMGNRFTELYFDDKIKNVINKTMIRENFRFEISKIKSIKKDRDKNKIVLETEIDFSKFITKTKTGYYIKKTLFKLFDDKILKRETDNFPIHFESRQFSSLTIHIGSGNFDCQGESLVLGDSTNLYFETWKSLDENGRIALNYKYNRLYKEVKGERKKEMLGTYREYLSNRSQMYLIKEKSKQ